MVSSRKRAPSASSALAFSLTDTLIWIYAYRCSIYIHTSKYMGYMYAFAYEHIRGYLYIVEYICSRWLNIKQYEICALVNW